MTALHSLEEILLQLDERPPRLVSLVPSYTESLFDLGFGQWVIGVTDYCSQPARALTSIARVGGVRDPNVQTILGLKPDLVIANQEENSPETVRELEKAGMLVWLSFPHSVPEMFEVLLGMVRLFHDEAASMRVRTLETSFDWAVQAAAEQSPLKFFCPIWQGRTENGSSWWMTFNQNTYSSNLLEQLGGVNICRRERLYPLEADLGFAEAEEPAGRDTRYPRLILSEILVAQPELILLPDEPWTLRDAEIDSMMKLFADTPAVKAGRVFRVDGSLITWYGTRIGQALETLPALFELNSSLFGD